MSCLQNEGNEAFKAAKYPESVQLYTQGLDIDPDNHILYSNRSAAYLKINERGKVSESTVDSIAWHLFLHSTSCLPVCIQIGPEGCREVDGAAARMA